MLSIFRHTHRWYILAVLGVFYLIFGAAFRVVLYLDASSSADFSSWVTAKMLAIGAVYDAAFLSYALIPVVVFLMLLPNKVFNSWGMRALGALTTFALVFGVLFIANSEWIFWEEFDSRFNFIAVDYLVYTQEVTQNIQESYSITTILGGLGLIGLVLTWFVFQRYLVRVRCAESFRTRLAVGAVMLMAPALTYALVDQNLKSFDFDRRASEIAGNGPYQFFAAFRNNTLDYQEHYLSVDNPLASSVVVDGLGIQNATSANPIRKTISPAGAEQDYNVVLVSIESLSASYTERYGNTNHLTPNMDKLMAESLTFDRMYATGTRTTRGLEAITLSIPPTPGRSVIKRPEQPPRYNISTEFQNRGYDVAYFYGGNGYFDNMNQFFSSNGYRIVDKSDLSKEEYAFSNAWGVADEYIFDRLLKEADTAHETGHPFMYHLMTTSNHQPYSYPEGRIVLPQGKRPSAVSYTDWAIGDFIRKASTKSWFDNTVFVFLADHTARVYGKSNLDPNRYHIPAFMYAPKIIAPKAVATVVSQIDIAPTLLGLMNFQYDSTFFGKDINQMAKQDGRAFIGTYQLLGMLGQDDKLVYLKPGKQALAQINSLTQPKDLKLSADSSDAKRVVSFYQLADQALAQGWLNSRPKHLVAVRK